MFARSVEPEGFALIPEAVSMATVTHLLEAVHRVPPDRWLHRGKRQGFALRGLLTLVPEMYDWVISEALREWVEPVLGPGAFPVQGLLFDKHPEANWPVAWHQDLTIPVRERKEVPGFGPWTLKAGQPHVQPPPEVLERMLILRLHLDDCPAENGALRVLPGSHRSGRLSATEIQDWRAREPEITCAGPRGSLLLMRPLLLHASSPAVTPAHRRVIHVEFAAHPLPGGLKWPMALP